MMNSRPSQQSYSGYVAVSRDVFSSRPPDQMQHREHMSQLRSDVDSAPSIHQGEDRSEELPRRHGPQTDVEESARSDSRTFHHSRNEGQIAVEIRDAIPLQPSSDVDSAPLIPQDEDHPDELPRNHSPRAVVAGSARSVSRASHGSGEEAQIAVKHRPEITQPTKEWRSWKLSWWFNTVVLLFDIGFIVAIVVLDQLSVHNGGIVTVPTIESSSHVLSLFVTSKNRLYYGLLWTTFPSFIFTLYSIAWAALVAASYERQPFIELQGGSNIRRTIMLDYRAYSRFYNWVLAIRHKHNHIGCAMLLSLFISVFLSPLSAHLFVSLPTTRQSSVSLSFPTQYNDSLEIGTTNLQPFIDIATAVHAYGSTPPAWMTIEYAFAPFTTTTIFSSSSANLSATTNAYSAYLDCQALEPGVYTVSYNDRGIHDGDDVGIVTVKFSDRSCFVQPYLTVSSNTPTYALSWFATCPGQPTNRLGMLAGTYSSSSPSKLIDFSVVSCIPSYWLSTGSLTVSLNSASPLTSNYITFTERTSAAMDPVFSDFFELVLHEYTIFNPAAAASADALGFAILSAAITAADKNATAAMAPEAIKNATELVFTTVYAALATSELLTPVESATSASGVLVEPVNRLFVVRPIAYVIVAVLASVLVSHVALWVYAVRHRSVLGEEPVGLLGNAVLLEGSAVSEVVSRVRTRYGVEKDIREGLEEGFDVKGATCFWNEHEGRIEVIGLAEK